MLRFFPGQNTRSSCRSDHNAHLLTIKLFGSEFMSTKNTWKSAYALSKQTGAGRQHIIRWAEIDSVPTREVNGRALFAVEAALVAIAEHRRGGFSSSKTDEPCEMVPAHCNAALVSLWHSLRDAAMEPPRQLALTSDQAVAFQHWIGRVLTAGAEHLPEPADKEAE